MKIDSHQHFWQFNKNDFPWIGAQMEVLQRDFLPEYLLPELDKLEFDGSIAIEARQTIEESKWLLELADKNNFIKGVVGWVDLCSPAIENQLVELSKHSKFVGVRHVVQSEPDDNFMARDDFQHGISMLSKYGLTYDLLIFPKHLKLATELVAKFPKQKFVLDHIAKPLIKDQLKSPWNKDITSLAEHQNAYCKLSGMVTEADWKNWKPVDFHYYLDIVYNVFGEDRLMIGSDWPVCTVAGNYVDIMTIVIDYFENKGNNALDKILGDNCMKFYKNSSTFDQ
jgi:L-fuconolactonase